MGKTEKKQPVAADVRYSLEMLLEDILATPEETDSENAVHEKAAREREHKLKVMQMLVELAIVTNTDDMDREEKMKTTVGNKLEGNELLSGYMFFVAQNPQFDYSWNYMRKCKESYNEFLANAIMFLWNVVYDINMMANKDVTSNDVHVVFDDLIDVKLTKEKPYAEGSVMWENFKRLASVKANYSINVKMNDYLLAAGMRKKAEDAEKLMDAALERVARTNDEKQ